MFELWYVVVYIDQLCWQHFWAQCHPSGAHELAPFSMPWCPIRFPQKNDVRFILTPSCFLGYSCFIYVLNIYLRILGVKHDFHEMFDSRNCNGIGVICRAGTASRPGAPEFTPGFWWGSCYSIFSFLCSVLYIAVCLGFFLFFFLCRFSFGHCVVCPSSIYGFLLPFWYFQTFLKMITSECYWQGVGFEKLTD